MKTRLFLILAFFLTIMCNAQISFDPRLLITDNDTIQGVETAISADMDGDGDEDVLVTSWFADVIAWYENLDGNGNFSSFKRITGGILIDDPNFIQAADMDNDGDLDVVVANWGYDPNISWIENLDGQGTFGNGHPVTELHYALVVHPADIDNDGDMDLVAVGDYHLIWMENLDGLGNFGPQIIISDSISVSEAFEVSDIDGDGDLDITYADSVDNMVVWYENTDGQGTFGPQQMISDQTNGTRTVITKDMDHDGYLDVVSTSFPNGIVWFKNMDGQGTFMTAQMVFATAEPIYEIWVEDLDADGNNDVIAANNEAGKISWFKNDAAGNFGTEQILLTDLTGVSSLFTDDYNGDGKMDILTASFDFNDTKVIWLENRGPLGIEENSTNLFSIYPNPTNGLLHVKSTLPIVEITLYNNLGQLLFTSTEKNQVDISTLTEGIYFVKIINGNSQTETKKIVKK